MVSQTNINGAFTCALVKDRDMGNFMGEKKKKNEGGKFQFYNPRRLKKPTT